MFIAQKCPEHYIFNFNIWKQNVTAQGSEFSRDTLREAKDPKRFQVDSGDSD